MTDRRRPTRGRRRTLWSLAAVLLLCLAAGAVVIWQHDYDLSEEQVSLRHDGRSLDGVLALPSTGDGPFGLVVFVHGDGPIDATHETHYRPLWESFARAGYASLSFSKPGVGRSEGDWLGQSMADRAAETRAAIAWARTRPEIDPGRIGLWGASQAGWVLPKVAAAEPGLRFMIAVSPAVNWQRQGRYNLLAELSAEGAGPQRVAEALRDRETVLGLLDRGASFEDYRAAMGEETDMTARRWGFIQRNHTADATADLRAVQGLPVLLAVAGNDLNVDVTETEAAYRELLPELRVMRYPDAAHSMVDAALEQSPIRLTLTGVFAPRRLYTPGFLDDQADYLRDLA